MRKADLFHNSIFVPRKFLSKLKKGRRSTWSRQCTTPVGKLTSRWMLNSTEHCMWAIRTVLKNREPVVRQSDPKKYATLCAPNFVSFGQVREVSH